MKTADGKVYAFRHLENLWRGEIAWSSGIKKEEPHGNQLRYEKYKDLMGSTVKEIVLITKQGYITVNTDTYIPVKFAGTLTVENGNAGTGSTSFAAEGVPADYQQQYAVADGFTAADGTISYTDAKPGSYKLTVSDGGKKYADIIASFTLETDAVPVQFKDGKLVKADDAADAEAENFIRNLSKVEVGETAYNASGKGSVKIFDETGAINFDAESRNGKVFADGANGSYTLKISATGYRNPLTVQLAPQGSETTAPVVQTTAAGQTTTVSQTQATAAAKTTTAAQTNAASKTTASRRTPILGNVHYSMS